MAPLINRSPRTWTWSSVSNATSYAVLVSTNSNFSTTVFSQTGLVVPYVTVSGLTNSTTYYWQAANTTNPAGIGAWSGVWSFTTIIATPVAPTFLAGKRRGESADFVEPELGNGDGSCLIQHTCISFIEFCDDGIEPDGPRGSDRIGKWSF